MNDYLLIRENLIDVGRYGIVDRPWLNRWYVVVFCFLPAVVVLVLSADFGHPHLIVLAGHLALAAGTFFALSLLDDRPLLNPIQAVVFLFHWWFAIGPAVAVAVAVQRNDYDMLATYLAADGTALWIVAAGLPVYAIAAKLSLQWSSGRVPPLHFLLPDGLLYRKRTLIAYWLFGGTAALIVAGLARIGIVGSQPINYLGGQMSENWFVSSLEALNMISLFASIGVLAYLAGPPQRGSFHFKLIAVVIIIFNTITAMTSGWKGAIIQVFVILALTYFVWRQKVPFLFAVVLLFSYLFFIEPFVNQTRHIAEILKITTTEERVELFQTALADGISWETLRDHETNVESPFRFIFPLADGITADSKLFFGPWAGTITDGLLALIPRAIYPDKPDLNMGNTFAYYLGKIAPDDYTTNMGVSIPFEFVGNYGYMAGIASFALIGVCWALFCSWVLSPDRLATHPLSPLLIIFSLGFESSVGQFLAKLRDLPIVLCAAYIIWIFLKRRL